MILFVSFASDIFFQVRLQNVSSVMTLRWKEQPHHPAAMSKSHPIRDMTETHAFLTGIDFMEDRGRV